MVLPLQSNVRLLAAGPVNSKRLLIWLLAGRVVEQRTSTLSLLGVAGARMSANCSLLHCCAKAVVLAKRPAVKKMKRIMLCPFCCRPWFSVFCVQQNAG